MTVFTPDGTLVSETRVPPIFTPARSFLSTVSGHSVLIPGPGSNGLGPKAIKLLELDSKTGDVLWTRHDLEHLEEDGCFPIPGIQGAGEEWVFKWSCSGDLYFWITGTPQRGDW